MKKLTIKNKYLFVFTFFVSLISVSPNLYPKKQKRELSKVLTAPFGDFESLFSKNITLTGSIYGIDKRLDTSNLKPLIFHKGLRILEPQGSNALLISNRSMLVSTVSKSSDIIFSSMTTGIKSKQSELKSQSLLTLKSENDIYITTEDPNRPLFPASHYPPSVPPELLAPPQPCNNSYIFIEKSLELEAEKTLIFSNIDQTDENFWGVYMANEGDTNGLLNDKASKGGSSYRHPNPSFSGSNYSNLNIFQNSALRFRIGGNISRSSIDQKRGFIVRHFSSTYPVPHPIFQLDGQTGDVRIEARPESNQKIELQINEPLREKMQFLLPSKSITLYYGNAYTIPSGWHICDGTNNTPNLRNLFIRGASQPTNLATINQSINRTSHTHESDLPETTLNVKHSHAPGQWGTANPRVTIGPSPESRTYPAKWGSRYRTAAHWHRTQPEMRLTMPLNHTHYFDEAKIVVGKSDHDEIFPYNPPPQASSSATAFPPHRSFFLIMKD
ncbi:hypothetical protein AB834_05105 [PVC group bacterium (ex Bugula neritina AB1)]|nr:hypothetical protein AB834_05105 [PVC group bacterium (ex Bugula neritina AB1)]